MVVPLFAACRHDLDLLVELNVNNQAEGHFEQCRDDCLHTIQTVLCTIATAAPAAAAGSRAGAAEAGAAAVAASGWQLKPCLPHWLRLYHPVLDLQLDIHVRLYSSAVKAQVVLLVASHAYLLCIVTIAAARWPPSFKLVTASWNTSQVLSLCSPCTDSMPLTLH